jgi:hypothetical protein
LFGNYYKLLQSNHQNRPKIIFSKDVTMQKFLRLLGLSLISLSLVLGFAPDSLAKKGRSSAKKSAKSNKSSRGKAGRSSKRGEKVSRSSRRGRKGSVARHRGHSRGNTTIAREERDEERNSPSQNSSTASPDENLLRAVNPGIPQDRVMEIQAALNKAGYYSGEVNGVYDETTRQAMKQYQQANNLSPSGMPSAHALKKLGVSKRSNASAATPIKKAVDGEN